MCDTKTSKRNRNNNQHGHNSNSTKQKNEIIEISKVNCKRPPPEALRRERRIIREASQA